MEALRKSWTWEDQREHATGLVKGTEVQGTEEH